jgi:hypothetical protein
MVHSDPDRLIRDEHLEVIEQGHLLATADIETSIAPHGTARIALHAEAGHLRPGVRQDLVDTVLDLPQVQLSDHLQASIPLGDSESMNRLRQRTTDMHTHSAGSTALIAAELLDAQPAMVPEVPGR